MQRQHALLLLVCVLAIGVFTGRRLSYASQMHTASITYLPVLFSSSHSPEQSALLIQTHLFDVFGRNPDTHTCIMPESACYCIDVFTNQICTTQWNAQNLGRKTNIIAGSFRWDNGMYRNCCYFVKNGKVRDVFDKKSALPFTEYLPSWCRYSWVRNLFLCDAPEITPSNNERPLWRLDEHTAVVPYLCSELFLSLWPEDTYPDYPLLALVCDRWFPSFIRSAMLGWARLQSFVWGRPIIYVSFSYGAVIMPNFTMVSIAS